MSKTPATIFTGFLGSGKTTIIANLLDDLAARGEKCVYIKNEVGDLSTDALILKNHGSQISGVRELTNGCICCTLTGQLSHAVTELIETYYPDRILIESAGTAKPHDLALAVSEHPLLSRDGLICVIDTQNFNGYERVDSVAQKQAEFTDILLFNKVELVDQQRLQAVVGYVREVNLVAPIIEAPHGRAPMDVLCGVSSQLVLEPEESHHHEAADGIDAVVIKEPKSLEKSELEQLVGTLPKTVFRVKGVLRVDGKKQILNAVCGRVMLAECTTNVPNQITLIGYHLSEHKEELNSLWSS